jgi:translocation and assembly module TamB
VDAFEPGEGRVALDLRLVDRTPILVSNNLIDAEVRIEDEEQPFRIVGTDARVGALGTLTIPRGIVHFRNNDFDVRRGVLLFRDPNSLDAEFDVEATTEILRTNDFAGVRWLVTLVAHGTPDAFELETRSDPPLGQEDLVLLLTVGMTRAEAQQLQAGDLTGTAALEALAAVSGVDREIQEAVPVIDDFGISSRYSPLTNRTEPQVSIGKRITDRVRLSAATGLGQTREVRTSIEWRLDDETSVQALYDNVATTGTTAFGNVGVDLRWRLEFE